MRISGYGEFQQMRKLASKEDAQTKNKSAGDGSDSAGALGGDGDAVQISSEARKKIRMRQASDFRDAKVAETREKMNSGTLVTPESLKRGTAKMLNTLISGDL